MGIDPTADVHATAVIEPGAEIGPSCRIGPYCVIGGEVVLGARVRLLSHVAVAGRTAIGEETEVIDSYVGPYTAIYHHSRLIKTEIEASMVLERTVIDNPGSRIHESMIGRDCMRAR